MRRSPVYMRAAFALALAAASGTIAAANAAEVPTPAVAPAPPNLIVAQDIVSIAFPIETREATFNGAVDALLVQMRRSMLESMKNDPGAEHIVTSKVESFVAKGKAILKNHIPSMMDGLAKAYTREFSEAELIELRAFAKTPTGKHFLQRSSSVLSDPDFAAANEAYMRELQPAVEKMREELVAELTAYFIEHPPKPSSES